VIVAASTAPRALKIGQKTRKVTLVTHIVSAGAWIGIDVVVGALVLAGWLTADPTIRGAAYVALGSFVVVPMLASGLVCLVSGLVLGLGTRYGLVRYWWVAIKLVMNVVLCVLIVFLLRPGMPDIVEHGRHLLAGSASDVDVSALFFPPAVSLAVLATATVLAVFKPFGRVRSRTDAET
jgi:hypothetical protein